MLIFDYLKYLFDFLNIFFFLLIYNLVCYDMCVILMCSWNNGVFVGKYDKIIIMWLICLRICLNMSKI